MANISLNDLPSINNSVNPRKRYVIFDSISTNIRAIMVNVVITIIIFMVKYG